VKSIPMILAALGLVAQPGFAQAAPEGNAERGAEVAAQCTACHQADGAANTSKAGNPGPGLPE